MRAEKGSKGITKVTNFLRLTNEPTTQTSVTLCVESGWFVGWRPPDLAHSLKLASVCVVGSRQKGWLYKGVRRLAWME